VLEELAKSVVGLLVAGLEPRPEVGEPVTKLHPARIAQPRPRSRSRDRPGGREAVPIEEMASEALLDLEPERGSGSVGDEVERLAVAGDRRLRRMLRRNAAQAGDDRPGLVDRIHGFRLSVVAVSQLVPG
jgi:hypothetical protein